jgi:hypothetical protein
MANQQDRINTIVALLNSNSAITHANFRTLKAEFEQVLEVNSISPMTRRNLMKVLHSTRGLDTTLKNIVSHYHLGVVHSLGPLIDKFYNHSHSTFGKMFQIECNRYKRSIADIRNTHLHSAGSYPRTEGDVSNLISEMEALLTRVLSL